MRWAFLLLSFVVGCGRCERRPVPPQVPAPAPAVLSTVAPPPVPAPRPPPDPLETARQAARALHARGDTDGAIAALDRLHASLPAGPDQDDVACELAILFNNRAARALDSDLRAADDDSARAVTLCKDNAALKKNRAGVLFKRASEEEVTASEGRARARGYLEAGLALDENAAAHALLAEIYYKDDDAPRAAEHARRAAELAPDDSRIDGHLKDLERKTAIESGFRGNRHTHFVALFEGYAQERLAWSALDLLEQAYFSVGTQLDVYPRERITVVIYSGDQYKRAVNLPDWSTGAYDGKIRINEAQLQSSMTHLRSVLRHEYTHAVLATLNRPLPAWLNEGLAEYFEGSDAARAAEAAARAARDGRLVAYDDLVRPSFVHIADTEAAQLAYAQALCLVDRLVDNRGIYALQGFIGRLARGEEFDAAFTSAYAISPTRHYQEWLAALQP